MMSSGMRKGCLPLRIPALPDLISAMATPEGIKGGRAIITPVLKEKTPSAPLEVLPRLGERTLSPLSGLYGVDSFISQNKRAVLPGDNETEDIAGFDLH